MRPVSLCLLTSAWHAAHSINSLELLAAKTVHCGGCINLGGGTLGCSGAGRIAADGQEAMLVWEKAGVKHHEVGDLLEKRYSATTEAPPNHFSKSLAKPSGITEGFFEDENSKALSNIKGKGFAGNIRSILSKIKNFFRGKALLEKAEIDGALDTYVSTLTGTRYINVSLNAFCFMQYIVRASCHDCLLLSFACLSDLLDCVELLPSEKLHERHKDFCKKFNTTRLDDLCTQLGKEALQMLTTAYSDCKESAGRGLGKYPLRDFVLPALRREDFAPPARWGLISQLQSLFSLEFPTRLDLHKRVEREINRIRGKAGKSTSQGEQDKAFWVRHNIWQDSARLTLRSWQLVVHEMRIKPHMDPMLIRLVLLSLSFEKCPKKNVPLLVSGKKQSLSSSDIYRKALGAALSGSMRLQECTQSNITHNCQTLLRFLKLKKSLQAFSDLDEDHLPNERTDFSDGEKVGLPTDEDIKDLRLEIEEDAQADIAYARTAADSGSTKIIGFIAKSRIARIVISSIVRGILHFVQHFRKKAQGKTCRPRLQKRAPAEEGAKLHSESTTQAVAFVIGSARASSVYCMSGNSGLAKLQQDIVTKILASELKKEREKQLPKRSIGQKLRDIVMQRKKQFAPSFLLSRQKPPCFRIPYFSSTVSRSHVIQEQETKVAFPERTSLLQSVEESQGMSTTAKLLLAGGTFIFIGISMLGTMVPGVLVAGIIIAGIAALLIPLIKRVMAFFSNRKSANGAEEDSEALTARGRGAAEDDDYE
ncbi:uncharacterized protein LOC34619445 [Cyclospora cayetanensis]|uniref:Uncharacterized protein LOC34619445 n=1 Tax=Cyclospora cayetanensis TaxID=88456 RepID=A0A6P6RR36_9EIME|nr:uncharacterized protein LOC34619445 [Cyclospora cayetanensis]